MHETLKRQLAELGLDETKRPSLDQWRQLLTALSCENGVEGANSQSGVEQELKHKLTETVLLNHVIATVTSASDTNTILNIICTELAHALNVPQAACAILNDAQTQLTVVAEYLEHGRISALGAEIPVANNPATQYILKHHVPLVVVDAQNDERLATRELSRERGTVSMLLVPLMNRGKVIGTIGLNSPTRREFSTDEVTLAQSVASAAGQALQNAQLYEAVQRELTERKKTEEILRRQNEYMASLYEITLGLVNRLDSTSLIESIIARAATLIGTEHGYLYVASSDQKRLIMKSGLGVFQAWVGTQLERGESISGRAWEHGRTVHIEDYQEWEGKFRGINEVSSAVSVPLRSQTAVLGVIGLAYTEDHKQFGPEEIEILERFAQLAAVALDNAMLYSAAQAEIAERERTEQALYVAKEAAETASQMKSTFLASMSHELRTPLNAIIGYSELIQEDAQQSGDEKLAQDIQKIHAAGQMLLDIISDILDISKIEAGETRLYLETFNVPSLVRNVVEIIEPQALKNDNVIRLNCGENVRFMHADITKVRQSLSNLLSNAAKFTQRGEIELNIWQAEEEGTLYLYFEVKDNGIGIEAEKMRIIFEPFAQADSSTTRRYGGTGLGLAISRRYCRMMGGDISVESEIGRGSKFTIKLPMNVQDVL